jgi:Cof subfamily protein (haloacid dehalogenase superfamily)
VFPRGLAIDLDGTLLGRDERVSPRNRAALIAAQAAGLHIVVASARWFQIARQVAAEIAEEQYVVDGPAIACSGAQVRRLGDDVDLLDVRLPPEFAGEFYDIVERERCIAWAALDDEIVMKMEGDAKVDLPGLRQVLSFAPLHHLAPRMLLVQGTATCARIERELAPIWSDRVRFVESISSQGKRILTLTASGADKGIALRAACADLALDPADMVAFGDAENDLPMFAAAGASVAMGQASEVVRAAASFVSANNVDDGVAVAIERLLADGQLPSPGKC